MDTNNPVQISITNPKIASDCMPYAICVQDSDYNESWSLVVSDLDLEGMNEDELREALGETILIAQEDRVFIGDLKNMSQFVVLAE